MTALAFRLERVPFCGLFWMRPALIAYACVSAPAVASGQYNSYGYQWLYSGPRGTTVIAPPAGPGPLDPFAVWARFGFWPNPYIARQPIGHQTIATGPNSYIYRPVYADDETAASVALPDAPDDWARPVAKTARAGRATPEALRQAALVLFRAADYEGALDRLDRLLRAEPDDGLARLLAVQAYFALGNYRAAVGALSAATATAPERDWDRYVRDYRQYFGSSLKYLVPLRALEQFVEAHPDRTDARLLLAYEYGCLGFPDRALDLLARRRGDLVDRLREYFIDEPPAPALEEDEAPAGAGQARKEKAPARPHRRAF